MNCPGLPIIASEEYGLYLRKKFFGKRIPFGGGWELTLRCNLKCEHCYAIYDTPKEILSYDEITKIADELVEMGTLGLFLTGGEIMTRPDFPEIYLYLKKKGFLLTLFTNATHVTDQLTKLFKEYPPHSIEISVYGATRETYESLTRVPGSFLRFQEGLRRIQELGLNYLIKTVVTQINHHEFPAMRALADRAGVKFRYDASVSSRMTGDPTPCAMRLSPSEVVALDSGDRAREESWLAYFRSTRGHHGKDRKDLFTCGAGLNNFFISAQGKLYPCLMVREDDAYDLRNGTFREGFDHHLLGFRQRLQTKETRCTQCEIKPLCDCCPGFSYWEHGDLEMPVDYVCDISHLRYENFVEPHLTKLELPRIHRNMGTPLPAYRGDSE